MRKYCEVREGDKNLSWLSQMLVNESKRYLYDFKSEPFISLCMQNIQNKSVYRYQQKKLHEIFPILNVTVFQDKDTSEIR